MNPFKRKKNLSQEQQDVHDALERACNKLQLKNFAELERNYGYSKGWTTNNIKRKSYPFEFFRQVALKTKTTLDHLIFGAPEGLDENALLPIKDGIKNGLLSLDSMKLITIKDEHDLETLAKVIASQVEESLKPSSRYKKTA